MVTNDERVGAGLDHVLLLDVALEGVGAYESTELIEATHLREAFVDIFALEQMIEGDEALAVLEPQHEVKVDADVYWLQLVAENFISSSSCVCKCVTIHFAYKKN